MRKEITIGRRDSESNGDNALYDYILASQMSMTKNEVEELPQCVM